VKFSRGECDVTLSRGALREGVAALEAFGDLLGLRRVGPRALERAKSDTFDACGSLLAALGPFEHTLVVALGKTPEVEAIMRALVACIRSHVSPIADALAENAPISARRRLALEAVFRKHRSEFKDCVALCDLTVAAVTAMPMDLDVVELLEQQRGDRVADAAVVRVGIDVVRPVSIRADRHVLMGLVEAAVTFVNRDGPTSVRLVAGTNDDGMNVIRLSPAPRGWVFPKRTVSIPLRGEFDLAVDVARVVASRSDLVVNFDATTNVASILESSRDASC
jgi:hypothetical protein